MSPFDIRLVAYNPGGILLGTIETLSIDATLAFSDAPTFSAKVSELTLSTLPDIAEVALEYWHPTNGAWTEPDDARFLAKQGDIDDKDPAGVKTITGVGLWHWMMTKNVIAVGTSGPDPAYPDGHRPFVDATPGAIVKTFLDEAIARGWAGFLTYDFTHDLDSEGVAWPEAYTIAYKPGITAWLALSNLADQAIVEFSTSGRTLHMYRADHSVDRSLGNAPVRVGNSAVNMPIKTSIDDLITDVTVFGENGLWWDFTDGATNVLGRLEGAIQQGGVSRPGTAAKMASSTLQDGRQVKRQITASEDSLTSPSLPFVDYVSGDWVKARISDADESLRVMEIQIRKGKTVTIDTVLNDRFIDLLARTAKRANGILGGTSAGGTGVPPVADDRRVPKVPIDVVPTSEGYWTPDGLAQSSLAVRWIAVSQGTDDVDMNVDHYELWWRPAESDPTDSTLLGTVRSATFGSNPYVPGTQYLIKVRAFTGRDVAGDFTAEVPITMMGPVAVLDPPTDPIVLASRGVITVKWDGLLTSGGTIFSLPGQFSYAFVAMSESEAGTYTPTGQTFGREGGSVAITDVAIGETRWFRLYAVDSQKVVSPPSGVQSVLVTGVDGADLIADTVSANAIASGSIQTRHLAPEVGQELDITSNASVNIIVGQVAQIGSDLGETAATVTSMRTTYSFGPDGAVIGQPGSASQMVLSADGVEMLTNGSTVSSWAGGVMYAPSLRCDEVVFANHKFEAHGTGTVMRKL